MQQIDPNFDERNAGFNRFSKFVVEAGQQGVVQVTKLDNGQYEVAPARRCGGGGEPAARPRPRRAARGAPKAAREDGRRGRGRRGRGGVATATGDTRRRRSAPRGAAGPPRAARRRRRADAGARAFQLMTQALG